MILKRYFLSVVFGTCQEYTTSKGKIFSLFVLCPHAEPFIYHARALPSPLIPVAQAVTISCPPSADYLSLALDTTECHLTKVQSCHCEELLSTIHYLFEFLQLQ